MRNINYFILKIIFLVFLTGIPVLSIAGQVLSVKLEWKSGNSPVDLDLYVKNPRGEIVNWNHRTSNWGVEHVKDDQGASNTLSYELFNIELNTMDCYASGDYEFHIQHYSGTKITSTITATLDGGIVAGPWNFTTSKGDDNYVVKYSADKSRCQAAKTSNRLDVIALNQKDYSFVVNGANYAVGGCVPTTYAMMMDFAAESAAYSPVSPSSAIEKLLNVYAKDGVLAPYIPEEGTGVDIKDEKFINNLMYGNIAFNNCSSSIGYSVRLKRENSLGWNYDTFMTKVKNNIDSKKSIAISVIVFKKQPFTWNSYKHIGGHHMLITGYDTVNQYLYANDTWKDSYSTWTHINGDDYNFYSKNNVLANLNKDNSVNSLIAFRNEDSELGDVIIIIRNHSASFNTPESVLPYDSVGGGCIAKISNSNFIADLSIYNRSPLFFNIPLEAC